jgi:hypothetical protein
MYSFEMKILICLIIFLINFILAFMLKNRTKELSKQNKFIKFIYIIPPMSMIIWSLALLISMFVFIFKKIKEYFKD